MGQPQLMLARFVEDMDHDVGTSVQMRWRRSVGVAGRQETPRSSPGFSR